MTDTEMLDWMEEYAWRLTEEGGIWTLGYGIDSVTQAVRPRLAITIAAAKWAELNA